jgi:hypothetical protein
MAFPGRPTKDQNTATAFRPVSDADFARLSIDEKFRHVHLGMLDLAQALVELAAATTTGRPHGE